MDSPASIHAPDLWLSQTRASFVFVIGSADLAHDLLIKRSQQ